jgi:hypothetical protein
VRNALKTITGASAANTAKTHTITAPAVNATLGRTKEIGIRSLTVSTSGADPANDITVTISDNGVAIWAVELRSAQVFGGHFRFDDYPVICRAGDCTIDTDAAGASCLVHVSAVYTVI